MTEIIEDPEEESRKDAEEDDDSADAGDLDREEHQGNAGVDERSPDARH